MSFLDKIFRPIGKAVKSIANPIYNSVLKPGFNNVLKPAFNTIGRPLIGIASQLAPAAGMALGARFGGPQGAMMGGQLGGALGDAVNNIVNPKQQHPDTGEMMNMVPQQFQGQNFEDAGGAMSGYMGDQFGQRFPGMAGIGQFAANYMGPRMNNFTQSYAPEWMRGVQMGQAPSFPALPPRDPEYETGGPLTAYQQSMPARDHAPYQESFRSAPPMGYANPLEELKSKFASGNQFKNRGIQTRTGMMAPPPLPPRDHAPYSAPPMGYANPLEELKAKFASGNQFKNRGIQTRTGVSRQGGSDGADFLRNAFAQKFRGARGYADGGMVSMPGSILNPVEGGYL